MAPLRIAMASRGAGQPWYTWLGPRDLDRGALVAAPFRHRLELGVVLGPDPAPPAGALLACWPLDTRASTGPALLRLCELAGVEPHEILPHVLLDSPRQALRFQLLIDNPGRLDPRILPHCEAWLGRLTAAKRAQLAGSPHWRTLVEGALPDRSGIVGARLALTLAGSAGSGRAKAEWRKAYLLEARQARLLGLPADGRPWPGHYLAGLAGLPAWPDLARSGAPAALAQPAGAAEPAWEEARLDAHWGISAWLAEGPASLRRWQADWPELRRGLPAWLGAQAQAGRRVLAVFPQAWMLDRLWPLLAPWAAACARFRPEMGAAAAQSCLDLAAAGGAVIAGLQAAWKLLCHQAFDAVLLVDPTHPQYRMERAPFLDPRAALLCALGAQAPPVAELLLIELGLSTLDGRGNAGPLTLYPPQTAVEGPQGQADRDPLPLALRRPDRRYLVYFNRLGASRGIFCVECEARVSCPRCAGAALRWSAQARRYECSGCTWRGRELRCQGCGLSVLSAAQPGLEAVGLRAGDIVVTSQTHKAPGAQTQRVLGTSRLLDEDASFWPEELVYVHAAEPHGPLGATLEALDMTLRLKSLYANPALTAVGAVGQGLFDEFAGPPESREGQALLGRRLDAAEIAQRWKAEMRLRRLGGLPPYGCLYRLHLLARSAAQAQALREWLGARLSRLAGTTLLRLGRVLREPRGARLSGYWINPQAAWEWLLETRALARQQGGALWFAALRGPWD